MRVEAFEKGRVRIYLENGDLTYRTSNFLLVKDRMGFVYKSAFPLRSGAPILNPFDAESATPVTDLPWEEYKQ